MGLALNIRSSHLANACGEGGADSGKSPGVGACAANDLCLVLLLLLLLIPKCFQKE